MSILVKRHDFAFNERYGSYPSDWELTEIRRLGKLYAGGTPSTTDPSCWGGKNIWLVPSDLTSLGQSEIFIDKGEQNLTDKGIRSCSAKKIPAGAVCMSSRATIGECAIAAVDLYTNQGFINVVCNEKLNPLFLFYWVKQFQKYISRYCAGTTFLEISRRTFGKLKIALPEYDEQIAIAAILSKVDEAIAATEASIKAAERLKKALMQNLLTGKLKPDGTWRKEDEFYVDEKFGRVPVGWEIKKGNKITDKITKGQSPKWQGFEYSNEGLLFITSENVRDGYIDISEPKYLPLGFNAKIRNSQLEIGDILVNIVGASIGRSCVYRLEELANINQAICLFRLQEGYIKDFFAYYFQHPRTLHRLLGNQVETARANLSLGDFRKLKFVFPKDANEQRMIADKIAEFDKVVQGKQTKIKTLQCLKKSLMQNLLTGKIRLRPELINGQAATLTEIQNLQTA